jgi:hypothetical protein
VPECGHGCWGFLGPSDRLLPTPPMSRSESAVLGQVIGDIGPRAAHWSERDVSAVRPYRHVDQDDEAHRDGNGGDDASPATRLRFLHSASVPQPTWPGLAPDWTSRRRHVRRPSLLRSQPPLGVRRCRPCGFTRRLLGYASVAQSWATRPAELTHKFAPAVVTARRRTVATSIGPVRSPQT